MKDIITKTRTYRKFEESSKITIDQLHEFIELGRLGGSARNCQPWQYLAVNDPEECAAIFPYLAWAGYLTDWKGPSEGRRPAAYILCYLNNQWLKGSQQEAHFDLGIATQNMLLGVTASGLGGCRIGAFSPKLQDLYDFPEHLQLQLIIALGVPAEKVVMESCNGDDIKYWRDDDSIHHVPKRRLEDILLSSTIKL